MSTKITEHFNLNELTTTDYEEFKKDIVKVAKNNMDKLTALCWHLEAIRAIVKSPLVITSAVRTKELNKAIKGSSTSQHLKIEAVDFIPSKKSAIIAFNEIYNSGYPFGQLILEKRGLGYLIHFGVGTKREILYSPYAGKYEKYDIIKTGESI